MGSRPPPGPAGSPQVRLAAVSFPAPFRAFQGQPEARTQAPRSLSVRQWLGPGPLARPLGTNPGPHSSHLLAKSFISVDMRMQAVGRAPRHLMSRVPIAPPELGTDDRCP